MSQGDNTTKEVVHPPVTETTPVTEFRPTLASQVLERTNFSFANLRSLRGSFKMVSYPIAYEGMKDPLPEPSTEESQFRMRDNGDVWTSAVSQDESFSNTEAYDAETNTLISASVSDDLHSSNIITHNVDPYVNGNLVGPLKKVQSMLRISTADDSVPLKEVEFNGRSAWQFEARLNLDEFGLSPDHEVVTVDKSSRFPVHVMNFHKGQKHSELTLTKLDVNPALTDSDFVVEPIADPTPANFNSDQKHWGAIEDGGYVPVDISQAAAVVEYQPIAPHLSSGRLSPTQRCRQQECRL